MKNEKVYAGGWTTGRVVIVSISAVIVVLILSAIAVFYGVNATAQTFIKNNPELLSVIGLMDSSASGNQEMTQALLLAKYAKGSFDGTGQVDGSFKGRFTTTKVRSLEKVNLSCIDEYEYGQFTELDENRPSLTMESFKGKLSDMNCNIFLTHSIINKYDDDTKGQISFYKCPVHNCKMREVSTEAAGEFIPESIDVRKVQAGVNSEIGK